ncbi:hypothetical protein GCM10007977_068440 [Dactylosporangium sucinum]|uniref:DUF3152 domain-containing protein n=1 Tax=Dactylosporangium sucinum TaxID=1424081 RepID=A0A917U729_9ACTN|nr:hypothetical protein GCM10007977_068440 [Dactylosporangium sucinum]
MPIIAQPAPGDAPTSSPPSPKPPVKSGGFEGGGKPAAPGSDGVPASGNGTFAVASGGTDVVGSGSKLIRYRVEVENGIPWGTNPVWSASKTAAEVDRVIAAPRGWTFSAQHPVTYGPNKISGASWRFQRVSGDGFDVRLRLATPKTVDKLCRAVGIDTEGVYSCRYGDTILLNLRRWLKGIPGQPASTDFHANTVNHEMGHFLGFDHMKCPGRGPAPIMQTQTIELNGCTLNNWPFTADGTFVQGPFASS